MVTTPLATRSSVRVNVIFDIGDQHRRAGTGEPALGGGPRRLGMRRVGSEQQSGNGEFYGMSEPRSRLFKKPRPRGSPAAARPPVRPAQAVQPASRNPPDHDQDGEG